MKFKRTLAIILVILMILMTFGSTLLSVFADEAKTGAEELYGYGFIKGDNGDLMLDQKLTRAQATVLLSRMYGVENDASNFIYTPAFSDVKPIKSDWFYHYVSYAKSKGWVNGYSNGTFKPNGYITDQEWATMLLNVLGYDSEWATVIDTANRYNIHIDAKNSKAITREEAFEAMWDAVNTPINGKSQTLGQFLGKIGDAELLPESKDDSEVLLPTNFLVKNVEADNLIELNVDFIGEYDSNSATNKSNYTLQTTEGVRRTLEIDKIDVVDKDTVSIKLVSPVQQQEVVKITIDPIASKSGIVMQKKYEQTLTMLDNTPPVIESISLVAPQTLRVNFSEPMKSDEDINPSFDIDNKKELPDSSSINLKSGNSRITVKNTEFINNNRSLLIEVYTDLSSKNQLDFDVTGTIVDFVNYKINNKVYDTLLEKDREAPHVVGYKNPSLSGVTLIWNEDILINHSDNNNFYHTNATNTVNSNLRQSDIEGNELKLDFSNHPLTEGEVTIYYDSDSVKDLWGNRNRSRSVKITVPVDNIRPTILDKITYNDQDEIEINASEALNNKYGDVTNKSNYYLLDSSNRNVSNLIKDINYDMKDFAINIRFNENLNGNYSLSVNDLEDLSGNEIKNKTLELTIKDLSEPDSSKWTATVYHQGSSSQIVKIDFHEPMSTSGKYSILDLENYKINGQDLNQLYKENPDYVQIKAINNDQSVEITIANERDGGFDIQYDSNATLEKNQDLMTTRLADKDGNYSSSYENIVDLQGPTFVKILSAETVDSNHIKVTFNNKFEGFDQSDLRFEQGTDVLTITGSKVSTNNENNSVVTYEFYETLPYDANNLKIDIYDNDSRTMYGETLNPSSNKINVADGTPPAIALRNVEGNQVDYAIYDDSRGIITVKFTEDINQKAVSIATFRVEDYDIDNVTVTNQYIRISINEFDKANVRVNDDIELTHPLQDLAGNKTDNFSIKIQEIN